MMCTIKMIIYFEKNCKETVFQLYITVRIVLAYYSLLIVLVKKHNIAFYVSCTNCTYLFLAVIQYRNYI